MCIIIDTNTLPAVFDDNCSDHLTFKPVLDWICDGPGKVVFGGTQYSTELKKRYLGLFTALKAANKAVYIDDDLVDQATTSAKEKIQHKDFDDQHLVGLLLVSKCRLICSLDKRAYPFFQHRTFFSAKEEPKIYRSLSGAKLLCPKYFSPICLPCKKSTKVQVEHFKSALQILEENK